MWNNRSSQLNKEFIWLYCLKWLSDKNFFLKRLMIQCHFIHFITLGRRPEAKHRPHNIDIYVRKWLGMGRQLLVVFLEAQEDIQWVYWTRTWKQDWFRGFSQIIYFSWDTCSLSVLETRGQNSMALFAPPGRSGNYNIGQPKSIFLYWQEFG